MVFASLAGRGYSGMCYLFSYSGGFAAGCFDYKPKVRRPKQAALDAGSARIGERFAGVKKLSRQIAYLPIRERGARQKPGAVSSAWLDRNLC